jgi:DNA-binding HxlR family transcriptional regulator
MEPISSAEVEEKAANGAVCPHFHHAIELIGKRWTGAIVCALTERSMRYGELGKAILVERRVEAGTPVRVTYSLTEAGQQLDPVLSELKSWARRWKKAG